ncbi:hypothetical protein [Vibrio sp. 99-70-13A1]|uniref:hypothetical protein n=1 Tax=Vibrio sp. 99-70-13A1 TaxID=2607601 RepID=UPI0014933EEC|nr:hypothetical protein [Vibrio sp. 99-70-13A1]NOH95521.1 hypothetical protein [Vibrio sp. 99-70-13A1]
MRTGILKELSLLDYALSPEYYDYFLNATPANLSDKRKKLIANIYSSFCLLIKKSQYTAIDIFNSDTNFNKHFELLVGFLYHEAQSSTKTKYGYLCLLKKVFKAIAIDKQRYFNNLKLSTYEVSDDAQRCIENFQELNIDTGKLNYLNGWQVFSKDGTELELHLDSIYIAYGVTFTQQIHEALINYTHTQKTTTLRGHISYIKAFFEVMTQVCPNRNEIRKRLSSLHVQAFFHDIMNVWFALHLARGNKSKAFFSLWRNTICIYTDCFIDARIFDAPVKPFIVPKWKSPQSTIPTFSVGGQATEKEKERWFADIPIKIKDKEAITIIQSKIDKDLAYIRHVCMTKFKEFKERDERNAVFIRIGAIKPLSNTQNHHKYRGFVGYKNLANTVATFYAYGFYSKKYGNYTDFLGFYGKASTLSKELNLPTTSTLAVLSTLLVIEHPRITPAWLSGWKLFDKNGKQTGFKKSNNQYVAVSYKERKGKTIAQQTVVLNEFSKTVVEFLIKHTSFAREHLKASGKPAWRNMLLTAKVASANSINNIRNLDRAPQYLDWLGNPSLLESNSSMEHGDAIKLTNLISLRSVRKHRGLQIYLETRSIAAVAEALGHKKVDLVLLASYLPEQLMDFFNERWIRQFQNAILLEAMKDSKYRLDAVNMTAEDIEEFLSNHGLGHLPSHFDHGFQQQADDNNHRVSSFDEMTFLISTSLLQLLIAIRTIVESDKNEHNFLDIVGDWYQSAVFVLNSMSSEQYRSDAELTSMLNEASENALDINLIRGVLTC